MSLTKNDNELEKHLLTRCYDSDSRINELLESRYSITGDQKPSILFKNTNEKKKIKKSVSKSNKSTRLELKQYFTTSISNQAKLVKKIQYYQHIKKPLNIEQNLIYYKIPKFEDFINLNDLWQQYITSLIFNDNGSLQIPINQVLSKLSSADFNGCLVTVLKSRNKNIIGHRGIVVWDAQHSFIICVPRDEKRNESDKITANERVGGFKMIPKRYAIFDFEIIIPNSDQVLEFSIVGSRFEIRSVDRSNKKFKNHSIEDLL